MRLAAMMRGWNGPLVLRRVLGAAVGVLMLALAVIGGVAWRLGEGPVDVTAAARWLARREAPGVTLGRATMAIVRTAQGRALRLDVTDAQEPSDPGQTGGRIQSGQVGLALEPLLVGRVVLRDVSLSGVRGQWMRAVAPEPPDRSPAKPDIRRWLSGLQHVRLSDVALGVVDGSLGQTWHLEGASAEFDRSADGVLRGHAAATAAIADVSVHLEARASQGPDGAQLHLESSALSPAALAQASPALTPLAAVDAAITLQADATLDPAMALSQFGVHAESGPGLVLLPAKGGPSPSRFAAMSLDIDGNADAVTLHALRLVLAPPSGNPPSTLVLSGSGVRTRERFTARVTVDLDHAALADLPALWPERVGADSRAWLTENLTSGTVHDGHFSFTVTGANDGGDLALTDAGGALTGEDATVWWLRPVPPLEHAHAAIVLQNPDAMLITVTGGRQGNVLARTGTVRISGLAGKDQVANVAVDLAGPLSDVVTVLRNPRLNLLSKHPIQLDAPSGSVTGQLTVKLPLDAKVTIDQVEIASHGQIANAHLGAIAAGKDIDNGQLAFSVTNDGLNVTGPAQVDHIPGSLAVDMDFRAGPPSQVVQHASVSLRAAPADAKAAGLGEIGLAAGTLLASVDYSERRDSQAALTLNADLTQAGFATPLGWSKAVGSAGHAQARATLAHGRLTGLEGLRAEAPGLSVAARSELVAGRPTVIHIERGEIGQTSATGTIGLPQKQGEPYRVTLAGRQLDLTGHFDEPGQAAPQSAGPQSAGPQTAGPQSQDTASGAPYMVNLRFDRVILDAKRDLGSMALTASGNGRRLASGHLSLDGPARTEASMVAMDGQRRVVADVANLGALLRETGLATEVEGGVLKLNCVFDDRQPGSPVNGAVDLRNFTVRGAPAAGKVLQGVTLYGLVDALRGPGLAFDRLSAPFRLQGSVLDVSDARAFSSSLGVTATGSLDFGRQRVDLSGTIVPAYFFNSLPGRIPLLGGLFRTHKGSGLFAANYALRGSLSAPSVTINPLSALTPGFTRRFFDLFN